MALGLDDRSARLIHGRDVWTEIRDLLSGYSNIQAAIAYVGADADQHLPLRGPATIVVNAGDAALSSGSTDPQVLLRWTRRGVRVHSLTSLHAKVLLAEGHPSFVLVGSADVLAVSGRALDEAVLVADEVETVDELRETIAGWRRRAGEPLSEVWLQAAADRYRPPAPHRLTASLRPAAAERPAAPERAVVPDLRAAPTTPTAMATSTMTTAVPVPAITAAPVTEHPAPAAAFDGSSPPPDGTGSATHPPDATASTLDEPVAPVDWPRPKYIYLATLTRDGSASESAREQLDQLRTEFRVPAGGAVRPVLEVEMFWSDEPPRSGGRSAPSYREGWHIVPISVPATGRPAVLSPVDSPGRVLRSFTEFGAGAPRTYYYLLTHTGGPSTTYRKLREALTAVGEKPSYDHAYMMAHKVDAILGLWPQISYSD